MLDLWRPPRDAGEPIGCLATTYTFHTTLFAAHCLARFLDIESDPKREDLAFVYERQVRLGGSYAGVLVDHSQAGVDHSLWWDVLRVRIPAGKQHAKISLLAWSNHVRIIVASANLTDPGYRTNYEVAGAINLGRQSHDAEILGSAIGFLRDLLTFVPGAHAGLPEVKRAHDFLTEVERKTSRWLPDRRRKEARQQLLFTLPKAGANEARSTLDAAVDACRRRGGSPNEIKVASPFFDTDEETSRVTAAAYKLMARSGRKKITFCLPALRDETLKAKPRLQAPRALIRTLEEYSCEPRVEILPATDPDGNPRTWHAKMLAFRAPRYAAVMIGSSNFTCAGLGVVGRRNAEANLLTIVDDAGSADLSAIWPKTEVVKNPESLEWCEANALYVEEELAPQWSLPAGFLSAGYQPGDHPRIVLRFDPDHLPDGWIIEADGHELHPILTAAEWREKGSPHFEELVWDHPHRPEKLLVRWDDCKAFLALNVEDRDALPPPDKLAQMSADEMLALLAATDPSAEFRQWAKRQNVSTEFDSDLDSAVPIDLDPLRRHDLRATFLHRVRARARLLTQLRANLERPVSGRQALDWRLRGFIGVEPYADRLLKEFANADGHTDEALLNLSDLMIVLREVDYKPADGSLTKKEFGRHYKPFLRELAGRIHEGVGVHRERIGRDVMQFWERVVDQCRA
jgi:hypothetical protein